MAVGYYLCFNLSYRDIVEFLHDHGISVRSGRYPSQRTASRTLGGYEVVHDLYKRNRRELNLIGFFVMTE